MWSPEPMMLKIAAVRAAWPEARPRAAEPPSSAAIRASNTEVVGFMIRV